MHLEENKKVINSEESFSFAATLQKEENLKMFKKNGTKMHKNRLRKNASTFSYPLTNRPHSEPISV